MAANFPSRTTLRVVAVLSLLAVLAVVWWLTFAKADVEQRTVVRLTRPMATGDYLTGDDIEAVRITHEASDAGQYVTTGQAAGGLIAAHDLAAGDVLVVADVYTTRSDQIDVQGLPSEPDDGQAARGLPGCYVLTGITCFECDADCFDVVAGEVVAGCHRMGESYDSPLLNVSFGEGEPPCEGEDWEKRHDRDDS